MSLNNLSDRDKFHFCNHVADILVLRHETPGPRRRVLDEGPLKRKLGFSGISEAMADAGIWNSSDKVHDFVIVLGKIGPTRVSHFLCIDTFVVRWGIAVVHPQKATDLQRLAWRDFLFDAVFRDLDNFTRSKIFSDFISQVGEGACFKCRRVTPWFFTDNDGSSSDFVPCRINSFVREQEE